MIRLWTRVLSVALLIAGLAGGIYLGQDRETEISAANASAALIQADADVQLLKQRQSEHAAARAFQHRAQDAAAEKAASAAKTAASKAHKLETKVAAEKKAAAAKKKAEETGGPVAFNGPIPASCNEFSGSRAIGCTLMLNAGFEIDQFPCLNKLWAKESGWNYKAENKGSGAYGIPQALPGKKMASAGSDWRTNPATQIKWGLGYVKGRYKTPCGAWSNFQNNGSY